MVDELKVKIRDIPNFPKDGILFKDITTLLSDPEAYRKAIDCLAEHYDGKAIDVVVGVEARGFIISAALSYKLGSGLVLIRKPGKLPYLTHRTEYTLEYGTDELEMHRDAIQPGQKVLIADDLLATGGTVSAATNLVEMLQGDIVGLCFLVELTFLNGRQRIEDYDIFSLIKF
jgi:adenine phosphoribosyltransferase